MKKLKITAPSLLWGIWGMLLWGLQLNAQTSQVPQKGLIAYYAFSGDTQDRSGKGNHGQMRGGINFTEDRFGNPCSALYFNGRDGYIQVPSSPSLESPTEGFSVSAWFKISEGSPYSDLQWVSVLCKSDLPVESDQSPQYRFQSTNVTVSINTDFTENFQNPIEFDRWYFYTLTYDLYDVRLFLNAREIWSYRYQRALTPNSLPLEIGRDVPGNLEYFAGVLDDIRLYNRPLSYSEIQHIFQDESTQNPRSNPCGLPPVNAPVTKAPAPVKRTPRPVVKAPAPQTQSPDPMPRPKPSPQTKPVNFQETIYVKNEYITVYLYDHEDQDGDIISLKFDDEWVLEKHQLENKRRNAKKNKSIKLRVKPNQDHFLVSKAWNLGKIPPNTLTIEIHDPMNPEVQVTTINSQIGRSGAIRIRYEK